MQVQNHMTKNFDWVAKRILKLESYLINVCWIQWEIHGICDVWTRARVNKTQIPIYGSSSNLWPNNVCRNVETWLAIHPFVTGVAVKCYGPNSLFKPQCIKQFCTIGKMLLSGAWKREICFLPTSVTKSGTSHEKGKYVSLLKASESEEQGMKKANMFPSSKCNKVRNKAWKRPICFLPPSITKSGTRLEKGKYVSFIQV